MTDRADLAASVAVRLLNRAKETGDDHQTLLTSYCLERFLYRLGASCHRDRFVLKGAMLLRLWLDRPWSNGREYYAWHGKKLAHLPVEQFLQPAKDFLRWHNENRFKA